MAPVADYTLENVLSAAVPGGITSVHTCEVDTPVPHAITNMKEGKVGSIVITDNGRVKGLLSEKDYVLNLNHGAFCPSTIVAAHVMRPRVVTGQPTTPLIDAIEWMLTHKVRHMPVVSADAIPAVRSHGGGAPASPGASTSASSSEEAAEGTPQESMPASAITGVVSMRTLLGFVVQALEGEEAARAEGAPDTPAHKAFSADLEDVLEWQRAAGKDAIVNTLVGDGVTVAEAANEMAEAGVMSLVVVDEAGTAVGILTSRDLLWRLAAPADDTSMPRADATQTMVDDIMTSPVKTGKPEWSLAKAARFMLKRGVRHLAVVSDARKVLGMVTMSDLMRVMLAEELAASAEAEGKVAVSKTRDFLNVRLLTGRRGAKEEEGGGAAAAPAPASER